MSRTFVWIAVALSGTILSTMVVGGQQDQPRPLSPQLLNLTAAGPNRADEPLAATASLAKAQGFLDDVAVQWTRTRKCGTCHTVASFMLGRAMLGPPTPASAEVRKHFESRVANWDTMAEVPSRGPAETSKGWGNMSWWTSEVILTGVVLAIDDAGTTGAIQPATRQALDRMWTMQRADGGWNWIVDPSPPLEGSDYYGAALAAVGVGAAPGGYAQTPAAVAGLEKLRMYLKANGEAANLHDRAVVLWASSKIPDLLTGAERTAIVRRLLDVQRADGGWSLPSLGHWKRADGTLNDPNAPSDGYGTGFVTYVLRQAGLQANDPAIVRAVGWLKTNQRESGRWFTRSLVQDSYHFISHAGTVYAAMALKACEQPSNP